MFSLSVLEIQWKDNSRECFYWLQEPKTDGDASLLESVNRAMGDPSASSSGTGAKKSATAKSVVDSVGCGGTNRAVGEF